MPTRRKAPALTTEEKQTLILMCNQAVQYEKTLTDAFRSCHREYEDVFERSRKTITKFIRLRTRLCGATT